MADSCRSISVISYLLNDGNWESRRIPKYGTLPHTFDTFLRDTGWVIQAIRKSIIVLLVTLSACLAYGAEYSEADDIPQISSMTFTRDAVAITLQAYYSDGQYVDPPHFVANRTDHEFRQVSAEGLAKLTAQEHIQEETKPHKRRNYQVTHSNDCTDTGYRYDTGPQDLNGRRTIQIESGVFEVRMLCRSSIATALLLDGELWIATYEQGGHGEYGAEGVLVAPKNGASVSRLDVGPYAIEDIVADPWSPDVWIVTRSQLTRITLEKEIISRYWKYRDFDASSNRPAIFVTASNSEIKNNPLAVLADWLGEASFAGLSQAHRNGFVLPR